MTSATTAKIRSVGGSKYAFLMDPVGAISAFSPQTLFSVDNFIHYMTVSLEMLMNEVKKKLNIDRV